MKISGLLATTYVFFPLIALTFLWVMVKGKDRRLEVFFLIFVVVGGEIFEEGIRRVFHHLHPIHPPLSKHILYPFPSEQTLTALILFGFSAFLLVRHSKKIWMQTLIAIIVVTLVFLIGLSRVYFRQQFPSDIVAGYAFGESG